MRRRILRVRSSQEAVEGCEGSFFLPGAMGRNIMLSDVEDFFREKQGLQRGGIEGSKEGPEEGHPG